MQYIDRYLSPLGDILLTSNGQSITGLWIGAQQQYAPFAAREAAIKENAVLYLCKQWLDEYFLGKKPDIMRLPLAPAGNQFRQTVWQILTEIPYGSVVTYGAVAVQTARRMGKARMSPQAIGGAVGHNPIALIIPCHRVVGADGSMTGYTGGVDIKQMLLEHEGVLRNGIWTQKFNDVNFV